MTLRQRLLALAGAAVGLPLSSCSAPPAPSAHRGASPPRTSPLHLHPLEPTDEATTTTVAPTTTTEPEPEPATTVVTVAKLPPTTQGATTSVYVLPERAREDMGDVEWLVRQTFPESPDKAVRIARCESRLNPAAVNGEHVGVMQVATRVHAGLIARMGYTVADLYGARANLHVARAIYDDAGGWGPWSCQ